MTVSNDEIIQAVFTASDESKKRALQILQGNESETTTAPIAGPLLLGMVDAAKLLGVSRTTLWRLIKSGRLKKVEIYHNAFRLRRADLIAFANAGEVLNG